MKTKLTTPYIKRVNTRYTTEFPGSRIQFHAIVKPTGSELWPYKLYVWPTYRPINLALDGVLCQGLGHARRMLANAIGR